MVSKQIEEKLIEEARAGREKAYAPYSKYFVGAALLAKSGEIYAGANVENAVYRATHAEKVALIMAVSAGEREFLAIAIVTANAGFPCGDCRQDLAEFVDGSFELIGANLEGEIVRAKFGDLLPEPFGPKNLGIDPKEH